MQDDSVGPQGVSLVMVTLLVSAWVGWLIFGTVKVYAVTDTARIEVDSNAHQIQPQVPGVVVSSELQLGKMVSEGDVLLVLDSTSEQLQLAQESTHLRSALRSLEALKNELHSQQNALLAQEQATGAAFRVAQVRNKAVTTIVAQTEQENKIIQDLRTHSLATGQEALKSANDTGRQQIEALATSLEAGRIAASSQIDVRDRLVQIARLERDATTLQGEIDGSKNTIERLTFEVQRRTLRAPTSGLVADLTPTPPGTSLTAAQKIAVIVPGGEMRIIAQFPAGAALGRVHRGQTAAVRLDAFPWAEYGVVDATVSQVANEPQNGVIRVELRIDRASASVPVSHGLTGAVEVEVERTAPLKLLLRTSGQMAAGPVPQASPPPAKPSAQLP
jgi:membrane fusion protein (multidrug efflux system)